MVGCKAGDRLEGNSIVEVRLGKCWKVKKIGLGARTSGNSQTLASQIFQINLSEKVAREEKFCGKKILNSALDKILRDS